MHKFNEENQSPWLLKYYNEYFADKTDGYLIEIGVGHTLYGVDNIKEGTLKNLTNPRRVGSNTADLLDLGWSGLYIEPVKEYCEEALVAHANNLDRLLIANVGAGNTSAKLPLFLGDSFVPNSAGNRGYDWIGRTIDVEKTSTILEECGCPTDIDIMSIDVEGFEENTIRGMDFNKYNVKMLIVEVYPTPVHVINSLLPDSYKFQESDGTNAVWIKS